MEEELCKGDPTPTVTWWKDSSLLDDDYYVTPGGAVRNELLINRLQRDFLMSVLTCEASNSNLSMPVSKSVTLDLNWRQVELVCQSSGSRPPARIVWKKGSDKMSGAVVPRRDNVTISKIRFIPTIDDHGKYLSCQADNVLIPHSALEDGWIVTIFYQPRLTLSLGANIQHDAIREGSDVYFDCNIQANPWVSEIDGYAPVCKPGQKIVYGVGRKESVMIRCEVLADPTDVTFHWTLNNTFESLELRSYTTNKTVSEATYKPRTRYGYGILSCWAKNAIGTQIDRCNFSVIPAGSPDPVRNCDVTNRTITDIEVECEAGYNGGLKQFFHLEVFNSPLEKLQTNMTKQDFPVFNINDLPPGTNFILAIYASNSKGKSHSVSLTATTLSAPEKRTAKLERPAISPVLGILIGIVGALVLLAVLIVIIMRFRTQEQKKSPAVQDVMDKSQTPFQKDMDEVLDPDTRNLTSYLLQLLNFTVVVHQLKR
ncbi:uncharacterized protein LOC143222244 [Tachypleus tridentatus]|uniref:uncharacterized protein LOC143222244 n=1 Tax=Tachypleus tridentatus TaxID=6853 RepID=UPI003FD282BF